MALYDCDQDGNDDNRAITSPVIPAQAGILMRSTLNLIPVWRFTIADRIGNDD